MEIRTLAGVDKKTILQVFNTAFSDYFIPLQLTSAQLEAKMVADKTDLDLSVGAFENGQLTAFILHGFDCIGSKKVVYNGGTGVIPKKRGTGLTQKMYRFILPKLVNRHIDTVVLEVIKENKAAIRSYEKSGFGLKRGLMCYKGKVIRERPNSSLELKTLVHFDWEEIQSFWNISPTWQNSKSVVTALQEDYFSLGAYLQNKLVGYVVFNPLNNRILQIAVHKDHRMKGIGSTLIITLQKKFGKELSIINVDKSSKETSDFFKGVGFKVELEQLEMELDLKNYS